MNDKPSIAVAGAACVDMTLCDPPAGWMGSGTGDDYLAAPVHGLDEPVRMHLGGNGGAAAYVMGWLGARVHLNAPVGEDAGGSLVRAWLADAGVELVVPPAKATMFGITAATGEGKRQGTLQFSGSPIDWRLSAESDAAWLLVAAHAQVTTHDLERVGDTLAAFAGTAVLDSGVGWMQKVAPARLRELWRHVNLLTGTVEELGHWTQQTEPPAIAESVLQSGPDGVVIKMGGAGAAWRAADVPFAHQAARPVATPGLSIGAGDGFNGALIVSLARGESMERSVTAAQGVAATVVASGRGVLGWQDAT